MPTSRTETNVSLLGHCPDARCRGSAQRAVIGERVEVSFTYKEFDPGSALRGVEKSMIHFKFPDDATDEDRCCRVCGKHLELSDQTRPRYENLSGFSADGLLHADKWSAGDRSAQVEMMVEALEKRLSDDG